MSLEPCGFIPAVRDNEFDYWSLWFWYIKIESSVHMTKEGKEELCTKQKMENWYVGKRGRK